MQLENQLKAAEKRIVERNEIERSRRDAEEGFLKQQGENLEKFLKQLENKNI
jgi:hypothetical protein